MGVGEKIKEARKQAGLTQAQLAERTGVATITIRQYECGKRQPRIEQLHRIANVLGISAAYFMDSQCAMTAEQAASVYNQYTQEKDITTGTTLILEALYGECEERSIEGLHGSQKISVYGGYIAIDPMDFATITQAIKGLVISLVDSLGQNVDDLTNEASQFLDENVDFENAPSYFEDDVSSD